MGIIWRDDFWDCGTFPSRRLEISVFGQYGYRRKGSDFQEGENFSRIDLSLIKTGIREIIPLAEILFVLEFYEKKKYISRSK